MNIANATRKEILHALEELRGENDALAARHGTSVVHHEGDIFVQEVFFRIG